MIDDLDCARCAVCGARMVETRTRVEMPGERPRTMFVEWTCPNGCNQPTSPVSSGGDHGAGDAGLNELIGVNVVGDIEALADEMGLCLTLVEVTQTPPLEAVAEAIRMYQARLRKIADGIRAALQLEGTVEVDIVVDADAATRELERARDACVSAMTSGWHAQRGEGGS